MTYDLPEQWNLPEWHPDWDGEFTFDSLRLFACSLLSRSELSARLQISEPGLAYLEVARNARIIGQVYVNRSVESLIPIFSIYIGEEEDELHTTEIAAGVTFLQSCHSPFPDQPS